jgi:hypothetical protein
MSPDLATFTKAIELPELTKSEKFWLRVRQYTGTEYIAQKLRVLSERLRRCWAYARFAWDNYDFDSAYALQLLHFKLLRVQRAITSGYSRQEKESVQSLRLAIRLLKRLADDNYSYFYEQHNLKWHGDKHPEITFEKEDSSGLSTMVSARDRLPENQKERANAELSTAFDADDKMKARDRRWLFSILDKYYEHWWD